MLDFLTRKETRSTPVPEGSVPVSASNFLELLNLSGIGTSAAGVNVTIESALGVPAIWAAVNFIAASLAGLPLNVFERKGDDRERVTDPIAGVLHDAINDECSSFDWRKHLFEQVLTGGRAFTYIERDDAGQAVNLWPLDPTKTKIERRGGRKFYTHRESNGSKTYPAADILDLAFMLTADGLGHRGPIAHHRDSIGLAIAATQYGSRFFQGGGVPPFAVTGGFQSSGALKRAGDDLDAAVRKASREQRQALVLPTGLTIEKIGADPDKAQLVELKRFSIEEIARIYSLPPVFLQDLTHGTFSNTEQQDLHFVKHTVKRWAEQFEQELNLKLFGRANRDRFAELNLDGLLRGDFMTRMSGYATSIQNAIQTPNEIRRRENLPAQAHGDDLLIQGATVPLGSQAKGNDNAN